MGSEMCIRDRSSSSKSYGSQSYGKKNDDASTGNNVPEDISQGDKFESLICHACFVLETIDSFCASINPIGT